jgi:hypothetical protein
MRDTIDMAREAGFTADEFAWHDYMFERFEALVRADEREACAKVCENLPMQQEVDVRDQCATAIRARGNT